MRPPDQLRAGQGCSRWGSATRPALAALGAGAERFGRLRWPLLLAPEPLPGVEPGRQTGADLAPLRPACGQPEGAREFDPSIPGESERCGARLLRWSQEMLSMARAADARGFMTFHGKRLSVKLTFGSRGSAEVEHGEARSVR